MIVKTKKVSNVDPSRVVVLEPKRYNITPKRSSAKKDDDDISLAKQALRGLLKDKNTPAAAKAQAARTLLELNAALGKNAKPDSPVGTKPLTEMNRAELEAELAALDEGD